MIVRCPECSTGFKLPADRVGPKGAKVRCTKCDHVFRVRVVDGEPEIFYKPGEEPAKSGPAFSDFGNRTAFGGPNSFAEEDSDVRESGSHTAIGRPGDLNNLRTTPRKPLAGISPDDAAEESTDHTQRAGPMAAAGIVSKQRAGIVNKRSIPKDDDDGDDTSFAGPGVAFSEPEDDSTSIGKPIDDGYTPKATSFGMPAVSSGDDDPFGDEISDPEDAATDFGFPARDLPKNDAAFGDSLHNDVVDDDEDDDLRGTAFGRPAFQEAEDLGQPDDEPQFGSNPKGTLFGLPAVGGDDDEPSKIEEKPTVEVDEADLDLFADEFGVSDVEETAAPDPFDDPFAGAFEDQIDSGNAGIEVAPDLKADDFGFDDATQRSEPPGFDDDFADAFGADDDAAEQDDADFFGGGGGGSDFGDPSDLVDPSFGQDAPSFDPNFEEGDQDDDFGAGTNDEFDFNTGQTDSVDLVMDTEPPPAAARSLGKSKGKKGKKDKAQADAPKAAVPVRAATAPEGAGAIQKVMNLLLIAVLVACGFVGFIAWKTGGVVDFGRFDHMLAIVFDGKDFEPRPEWGLEKRVADEIIPLQTSQILAYPTEAADGQPLVVSGKVENKGTSTFAGVKINVALVGPEGAILTEKTVPAGTQLEPRKLKKLKVVKAHDAVIRQMSTMEPNSELPFVAVFEELPTNSMEELTVLVDVAEKTEVPSKAAGTNAAGGANGGESADGADGDEAGSNEESE
jgi:predicted Zn finger-like uncharacterized protein